MIGKTVQNYSITRELGRGGMGVVYEARDTRLDRLVALKFLPRLFTPGSPERKRFDREARAAAALNHPNIAHVYSLEEVDGEPFIVMEYVDGRELRDVLEGEQLPYARVLEIATQVATALKVAHERGVVHRDIKTANIMLTNDGFVKVMDFGLALTTKDTRLTNSGMVVGTVDYMSPEQVRGESADHRTDIWSLGVVLYEMVGGQRPYRGDYAQAVMYSVLNEDPPPLSTPHAELAGIIKKMLARNRDDRYASMDEVAGALQSLRNGNASRDADARNRGGSPAKTALPSVAVLPFASIRVDPDTEFLGFALADQVIGALMYVDNIAVRPSSAVRKYQGQQVDVPTAGRELHADFVLAGHYLKEADAVRLNVELVATDSHDLVWRDAIEVKYENAFKLQDIVSKKVLRGLKVQFPKQAKSGIEADTPASPLAYEYYLRAVSYSTTLDENRLAIEMLEKSIELDATFASAHAELGFRLAQDANYGMAGPAVHEKAIAAYRRALSLNDQQPFALPHLALRYIELGRHEEAIDLVKRMLLLTPNNAWAHFVLGYVCRYTGLLDRSILEVEIALELDPRNPRFRSAGFTYMYAGNYEKAHELFKKLDERSAPPMAWQGWALMLMGERERAIECFDRAIAMEPNGFVALRFGSMRAFLMRDMDDGRLRVRKLEEELNQRHYNDGEALYMLAASCSVLGDRERSLVWLRKSVEAGFFNHAAMLRDPFLDPLRDDPDFQRVLALAREKHEKFKAIFSANMP